MVSPIRFHTLHQRLKHTGGIKRNEIKIIEVSNTSNGEVYKQIIISILKNCAM